MGFSLLCVVCIVTVIMYDYSLVVVFITCLCMMMHLFGYGVLLCYDLGACALILVYCLVWSFALRLCRPN